MSNWKVSLCVLFISLLFFGCATQKDKLYFAICQHDYITVEKLISADNQLANTSLDNVGAGVRDVHE